MTTREAILEAMSAAAEADVILKEAQARAAEKSAPYKTILWNMRKRLEGLPMFRACFGLSPRDLDHEPGYVRRAAHRANITIMLEIDMVSVKWEWEEWSWEGRGEWESTDRPPYDYESNPDWNGGDPPASTINIPLKWFVMTWPEVEVETAKLVEQEAAKEAEAKAAREAEQAEAERARRARLYEELKAEFGE